MQLSGKTDMYPHYEREVYDRQTSHYVPLTASVRGGKRPYGETAAYSSLTEDIR